MPSNEGSDRATRYPIQAPLEYRRCGELEWLAGRTENMSRTGILFRAAEVLEQEARIEMRIELWQGALGGPGALVISDGRIVRALPTTTPAMLPAMAVRIFDYKLARFQQ